MIGHLYDENIVIKWSSYIGIGIGIGADILVIGISVNLLIGAPLVVVIVAVALSCINVILSWLYIELTESLQRYIHLVGCGLKL